MDKRTYVYSICAGSWPETSFIINLKWRIATRHTLSLNNAGPYEYAEGTAVGQCPGTEHLPIRFALEMHRNANGRYVTGEIESPYDFDEQIAMIAIAYKWANQGWKFMAKTESSYTCQHLKNILPVLFEEWTKNMNVSAECPVSAGPYEYAEGSNVGICPGAENSPIRVAVQIHRNANGRYISGEMESPFDFDDQFAMIAAAFKWANSGWKFLAKSESSYACHHLKTVLPLLFDVWTKHMNVTAECPIPAGPYEYAEGTAVGQCPEADHLPIRMAWQMHRNANGRYMSGEAETPFDFDDQIAMTGTAFKWANQGWKFMAKSESSYACQHLKNVLPQLFETWAKSMNISAECPIPAGKYKLNPFMTRVRATRFPTLPYGHFRVELNLTRHGKLVGCVFGEGNIQPTYD